MGAHAGHILILGLFIALKTSAGQAPVVGPPEQSFKLTATAELVLLDVSVNNATGEHVSSLEKNNFRVYEDGKLQTLTHFSSDDVPVTVGLVIDKSGSMRPKHENAVTAAIAFLPASTPNKQRG